MYIISFVSAIQLSYLPWCTLTSDSSSQVYWYAGALERIFPILLYLSHECLFKKQAPWDNRIDLALYK